MGGITFFSHLYCKGEDWRQDAYFTSRNVGGVGWFYPGKGKLEPISSAIPKPVLCLSHPTSTFFLCKILSLLLLLLGSGEIVQLDSTARGSAVDFWEV